jgi:NADH-quinone oxidoreductase subunit G
VLSGAMASRRVFGAVPFYAGLKLEEIGGRGVRWPETEAAASLPAGASVGEQAPEIATGGSGLGPAEVAGFRSVWDAPEVEHSPSLQFLHPRRELVSG